MAGVVFGINYHATQELAGPATAAIKQATYTFFMGGAIMKFCEYIAISIKHKAVAIFSAVLFPSVLTLTLAFGVHNLKGTPEPTKSTIPTAIIIPATAVWATRKRRQSTYLMGSDKTIDPEEVPS
jgi:hypothetical protein